MLITSAQWNRLGIGWNIRELVKAGLDLGMYMGTGVTLRMVVKDVGHCDVDAVGVVDAASSLSFGVYWNCEPTIFPRNRFLISS